MKDCLYITSKSESCTVWSGLSDLLFILIMEQTLTKIGILFEVSFKKNIESEDVFTKTEIKNWTTIVP